MVILTYYSYSYVFLTYQTIQIFLIKVQKSFDTFDGLYYEFIDFIIQKMNVLLKIHPM